jgi:hypothetical protein
VGYAKGPVQVHGHKRKPSGSDYGGRVHAVRKMTGKKTPEKTVVGIRRWRFFCAHKYCILRNFNENPQ